MTGAASSNNPRLAAWRSMVARVGVLSTTRPSVEAGAAGSGGWSAIARRTVSVDTPVARATSSSVLPVARSVLISARSFVGELRGTLRTTHPVHQRPDTTVLGSRCASATPWSR